ncbi:MAG TPA: STAS domain-containing protein [Gaiellaceae bacterium]|nr:STAS domain-containing protein [Gaiellaceae bacterium]
MATSGDFDVRSETLPGGAEAVFVTGELDLATAPRLDEALAESTAAVIVVDLSGCTFLDSAGIRALVGTARSLEEAGRGLRLVTVDAGILRLLEITGVDTLIQVHPSLDDAL